MPANATLTLVHTTYNEIGGSLDDAYLAPFHETDGDFDLVVVDGLLRVTCVEAAAARMTASGIILLDDADRPAYGGAHTRLAELGFGRLDFYGPKPGVGHMSATSLFSRNFDPWTRGLRLPPANRY
jgi:hypothetical protein